MKPTNHTNKKTLPKHEKMRRSV